MVHYPRKMLSTILAFALIFGGVNTAYGVAIAFKQYRMIVSHTATNYKTTISVYASDEQSAASMATLNGWQLISLEEIPVTGNLEDTFSAGSFDISSPPVAYFGYSSIMPTVDVDTVMLSSPESVNGNGNGNGDNGNTPPLAGLTLVAEIHFQTGSLAYENLAELTMLPLLIKPATRYFIVGYSEVGFIETGLTASGGSVPPQGLSLLRANKVSSYLQSKGASVDQISVVSYDSILPVYGSSYYKTQSNRRVEVYVYE